MFLSRFVKYKIQFTFLFLLTGCYFIFFMHLDSLPLLMWDESRPAVNALEMTLDKSFLVTHYNSQPDLWYVKPPMLVWTMAVCMKIFGYNELAVRFPSAACAVLTVILLFFFCKKYLGSAKTGGYAGFILMTAWGYVGPHVARTGDSDSMLILFLTISTLFYFLYLENLDSSSSKKQNLFLFISILALIFSGLTKGIAALLFLPGLFLYTLQQKKLKILLKKPQMYYSVLGFVLFVGGYYFLREYYSPGFLKAVFQSEIGERYLTTIEGHKHPFGFYLIEMVRERFVPWIYFLPLCFIMRFGRGQDILGRFSAYCFFVVLSYYLIVDNSGTKVPWYDAPMYPLFAIIIGSGISDIFYFIVNYIRSHKFLNEGLLFFILFLSLFLIPFTNMIGKVFKPNLNTWATYSNTGVLDYGKYLQRLSRILPDYRHFTVINNNWNTHLAFYIKTMNLKGYSINTTSCKPVYKAGDVIVSCDQAIIKAISQWYTIKYLDIEKTCNTVQVINDLHGDVLENKLAKTTWVINNSPEWYKNIQKKAKESGMDTETRLFFEAVYTLEILQKDITHAQADSLKKKHPH